MESAVISVEEAGRMLGVGRGTAYNLAKDGTLPVLRLRRRIVVPRAALDRLLNDPSSAPRKAARRKRSAA